MAVSLDSTSFVNQGSGTTNWSWLHTPVGAIQAVLVVLANAWSTGITITAVTYGGVPLTLVGNQQGAAGDEGTVYAYFRNGGLPTGAQNVAVTDSSNVAKTGCAWGLLAPNGAEVTTHTKQDFGVSTSPSFTVACPAARDAFIGGILDSGNNVVGETPAAGQTSITTHDHGASSAYISRKTSIHAGGNTTYGYTGSSFSHIMIAAAVSEIEVVAAGKYPQAVLLG